MRNRIATDGFSGGTFAKGKVYTISCIGAPNPANTAAGQTVSLKDGETVLSTLPYKGNMNDGNGNTKITAIANSKFTPAPATATLSLPALAGPASRRRRH